MTSFVDDITHVSRKYAKKINKSILLLNRLGITYLGIQKVTLDGQWSVISSNPAWIEYSTDSRLYRYNPTLINPKHYQSGICYMNSHANDDYCNIYRKHSEIFDLGNALVIIEKNEMECEFAFLATSVNNKNIINTYISKFELLRDFINNFKHENDFMFSQTKERSVDIKEINDRYFNTDNIVNVSNISDNNFDNLQNNALLNALSIRQQECLKHLLSGKTAKETAVSLGLSYRTIEYYFHILKKKLGCQYKRDLVKLFKQAS